MSGVVRKAVEAGTRSSRWLAILTAPDVVFRCLGILILALFAYSPAIHNSFIWDDDVMLTGNELMRAPDGLRRIWWSTELSDYFPLTSTSFWIEWHIWGMNAMGYNITNILLHAASGMLLWRLLLRLSVPGAWLAAVLFVLHPVCVASVDWIAERKNVLSMTFYLATFLLYLRYEQSGQKRLYAAALLAFLLALLSKTSVVMLPVVLLLVAWWQRNKVTRLDILRSVPFWVLSLVLGLVTVWFQLHEVLRGEAPETDTMLSRVLDGSWALWFYTGKILWPSSLSMIYPDYNLPRSNWLSYVPGFLWLSGLAVCWRFRHSWGRPFVFAFGYFTIVLFPVLGFFDMSFLLFSPVADHLQYIAVPAIIALVVGGATWVWTRSRLTEKWRIPAKLVAAAPVVVFAILTWRQSSVYTTEESLWRDTVRKNPEAWIGYHNLGDALAEQQRFDEAAIFYRQALALRPKFAKSHNNLGNCLQILGDANQAIDRFLDAIQNKPELAEAHHNLGTAYYSQKDFASALAAQEQAIRLKPDYASAYFQAGNCHWQLGQLDKALQCYFDAVRYNPDHPDYHYNLGLVLAVQGNDAAAVRRFQKTLKINPQHELAGHELNLLLTSTVEMP